ncbi:MAG TPA: glycosyltransferase [Spirochaetia bacterium]|nr:glycosyltransferase [Spirochaetia bacterium]
MRIALFTDSNIHYSDGVARIVQELARHVERNPGHALLICHRSREGIQRNGSSVETVGVYRAALTIPGYNVYPWLYLRSPKRALLREVRSFQPQVLLTVTPYILRGIGSTAFFLSRRLRVPVVGSFDVQLAKLAEYYLANIFRFALVIRFFQWLIDRRVGLFRQCTRILVPSQSVERFVQQSWPAIPTVLFRRAVDAEVFHPRFRSEEFRSRHGLSGKEVILFVGRLAREKNLPELARMYGRIKQRRPSAALLIVGEGPEREAVEAMGLPDVLFTGRLTGIELSTAYASSDVFAFASLAEAGPMVILEAMASGLPVVVARTGGARDDVTDGENGFVAPDLPAFEAGLERLISDCALRSRMGEAARRHAEAHGWDTVWGAVLSALAVAPRGRG